VYGDEEGYGYGGPEIETVLMEDEYGNQWYQEVEVDNGGYEQSGHMYGGHPGAGKRGRSAFRV
jgi:hypothetical protein